MKLPIAFLLSSLLCTQAFAQARPVPNPTLLPASTPQYAGVFHPSTGLQSSTRASRFGPEIIFNNTLGGQYYSVPGASQEWIDEGHLVPRNSNGHEQINGVQYTYCSTLPDPMQNSVSSVLRLYSENVYCVGPPNWPVSDCAYSIANLPGGDANGGLRCWLLEVNLSGGFECDLDAQPASNMFGWSHEFTDSQTGPLAGQGGAGTTPAMVWYDRNQSGANAFHGCFWFGCPPTCLSFNMKLYGQPAEVTSLNLGAGDPGRNMYLQASNTPIAGGSFSITAHEFDQTQVANTRLLVSTALDMNGLQVPGVGGIHVGRGTAIRYDGVSQSGVHDFNSIPIQGTFYLQAAVESAPNQPTRLSNVMQVNVL